MDQAEEHKNNIISFLMLSLINGIGFYTLKKIAKKNVSFYDILKAYSYEAFYKNIREFGSPKIHEGDYSCWNEFRKIKWREGAALYQNLLSQNIRIIFDNEEEFPQSLKEVSDPPKWLFIQGNLEILKSKSIAIVGTRKPSEDGLFLTKYVCLLIKEFGTVTVSGLATGIDQAVHIHSIDLGIPTIAVLGTGILSNYPSGSEPLRNDILNHGGTIVTEYLPNDSYSAKNFVNRNRLQAGLANIVMPIQWKIKSGTAHTFNFAKRFKKHIICFNVTTWKHHEELEYAKANGASVFTIPGEEQLLIKAVHNFQEQKKISNIHYQMSLFGDM